MKKTKAAELPNHGYFGRFGLFYICTIVCNKLLCLKKQQMLPITPTPTFCKNSP